MNSNFQFLKTEWSEFHQRAAKAEQLVITDPRTSLTYSRMALEIAVNWMFTNDSDLTLPYDTSLNSLMKSYEFKNQFPIKLYNEIDLIRKVGNLAIHNKPVSESDSDAIISSLYYFSKWFAKSYSKENCAVPSLFDGNHIPTEGEATLSKKQLEKLQIKFNTDLDSFQEKLKQTTEKNKQLEDENQLFKLQIEELQALISTNKKLATKEDEVLNIRNEADTRKYYIDVSLREAGWDLSGINDKEFKVEFMPQSTNKSETGFVDYVLWDDDGKPLGIVEAKKSLENARLGENQAQLYADSLELMFGQRPVMFYTNGFETYIWDDLFYKAARPINGFYTKQELQTLLFRRKNRQDIRYETIDNSIAGRTYQMRAIKSIAEHFAGTDKITGELIGTNRGSLLVLATGTGKTRTSIAFSKLMLQANWAKRILFLADRKSLVSQAKRNFVKLLPDHKSVNLLDEKDNVEARFAFSTYQTMMGLIDGSRDKEKRFYGVGHFDLIIVDEAHRSIYKKYQAIFEYFDALFLGLTATPKDSIDHNTYEVFGLPDKSPTDAYTFDEAVENKHLVPYKTIELSTKFLTSGIKYSDLSASEKEAFEEDILEGEEATGNEWVESSALNNWLFNKDTALKTLEKIIEFGIKKRGGEELGKTIIFAKNKKHAHFLKDMFMELDKELYGNDYVKVITHGEPKAEEFIERFCDEEKERLPQIVISVDMMDTGIDAPSCVNLVFYKPVKSYAKFWQMIGRGSRLRPDLFGPENDKTHFLIFDLCGNFEFFTENPQGIEGSHQKSLSEVVFNLRLQLAQYLKEGKFASIEVLQEYRTELLDNLFHEVNTLDVNRFDVRMKLKTVLDYSAENRELWNHLDKKDISIIESVLAPLIKPSKGDSDLARFYDKLLYSLMIKRLETPQNDRFMDDFNNAISKVAVVSKKLLRKTAIPEVKSKEKLIIMPLDQLFWENDGISHLEKIRSGIRDIVKYIDFEDQKYITSNFEDVIYISDMKDSHIPNVAETGGFYSINKFRLEEIIRENSHHITIERIRKGESITESELQELETILWSKKIDKSKIENEIGAPLNLVQFIVNLMGLDEVKVNQAFADFINEYQLTSVQIQFLNTIKLFLTKNGKIDPYKLYDAPFKNFHSMGIDGVFDQQQSGHIFKIIEHLNNTSHSA
ncbi:DEAD/DEAH box helicase family protein [Fluviicola taffensis]|uniref:Type I site-specific deoxyribonuclease n=1 Tax=Fluviicola taffensis (strain DSM 16823 / NCIMB 13979 / RW262) TaxID=755732 RepID=F2IGS9_FLUTR|nr:DEAD/DEAH box helicase family protein [Fluviicola taffensis]AEA43696.1 Type I site-specific deoxyribonuclease [Fluviicola taffensis DSM 16823]